MDIELKINEINSILNKMSGNRIVVFGDFSLDQNIVGSMEAISREAPIPIVRVLSDEYHPGGGGNTVVNVQALGMEVIPVGVIGDDLQGKILIRELERRDINTEHIVIEEGRRTQTFNKIWASSFHGKPQQVARYDIENYRPILKRSLEKNIQSLQKLIPEVNGIIVNDYDEVGGIGVISDITLEFLSQVHQSDDIVIVADSRQQIGKCRNFTAVVPNEIETAKAVAADAHDENVREKDEVIERIGRKLHKMISAKYVVVTRGDLGASVIYEGEGMLNVCGYPAEGEIDITGAGDTFAVTLTGALCSGVAISKAVRIANLAASIVVKKLYTTGTATPEEIIDFAKNNADDQR